MKIGQIRQKLKSRFEKRYVRKKAFESLNDEVKQLKKKIAKLEKGSRTDDTDTAETITKASKAKPPVTAKVSKANGQQDELTRIKGIGPVLEKKLNNLDIFHFSQIANWNEEEIEKISEHLSFKGRIQREEWVKQAKDLA